MPTETISLDVVEVIAEVEPMPEPSIVVKGIWGWAAKRLGIQPWGQILILILLAEAGLLFSWLWIIDGHLNHIEGSLQAMPLTIGKDPLSQAKEDLSVRKINRAVTATDSAEILLTRAVAKRIPAKPEDFTELVADLNVLSHSTDSALGQTVGDTRVILANYKSALIPQPRLPGTEAKIEKSIVVPVEAATVDSSRLPGSVLVATPGFAGDILVAPFIRRLSNAPSVTGVGFMFGAQHLDGWRWHDVAFVNTLIQYDGGELELNDVRFIQCTFEFAANIPRSAKVASYVALGQQSLKIGPND